MSRVLPTSLRPEFPQPSNSPRIPDLGVMTTGNNAQLKHRLRQRLQCKTGGSWSTRRAAEHVLPSTSLISLHFHKPSGYNSSPKPKERTKRNFNESAVSQPLMTAAWRSLSLKTAGWHGRSDAHVCCWRGKVLLYVSFTLTTAADNGSDRKTLITKDQKPNSGNASVRDPIFTGRSGRRKTHRANVQNIKTPPSDLRLSWFNEILLDVGSSRGKPEGPAGAHHPIASPKATTR